MGGVEGRCGMTSPKKFALPLAVQQGRGGTGLVASFFQGPRGPITKPTVKATILNKEKKFNSEYLDVANAKK